MSHLQGTALGWTGLEDPSPSVGQASIVAAWAPVDRCHQIVRRLGRAVVARWTRSSNCKPTVSIIIRQKSNDGTRRWPTWNRRSMVCRVS